MTDGKRQQVQVTAPDTPLTVFIDRARYEQVFSNLLSNASKYSPEGSRIEIGLVNGGSECRLTVRDHGIGISENDREKLFTPFFRANNPETRTQTGTGLGLVIVKSITELHGGRVQLQSAPEQGTEVTVTFPVRLEPARLKSEAAGDGEGPT